MKCIEITLPKVCVLLNGFNYARWTETVFGSHIILIYMTDDAVIYYG